MPEYLSPSVYVEEVDTGDKPFEGVSTSTAGMIGVTERGPVNVPILITSYGQYLYWFGSRLNILDYSDTATGAHCYLPHAIEGFFTNGGKRVYVTRILDTALAQPASALLFERETAATVTTELLRVAGEATGTTAAPPPLYLLDRNVIPIGVKAWFRVGDGSAADYVQADDAAPVPPQTFVPLALPLSRFHDVGEKVEHIARTPSAGYAGSLTVFTSSGSPAPAGTESIIIRFAAPADVAKLLAAVRPLLEIGPTNQGELRFALKAVQTDTDKVAVTLDSGLELSSAAGTTITPLDLPIPPANPADISSLGVAAEAGAPLMFLAGANGSFSALNDLVAIESNDPVNREVRRIGALSELTLSVGAYAQYERDTIVQLVTLAADNVAVAQPAPKGATTIAVVDVTQVAPNIQVVIDGATPETVTIQSVAPDPSPANAPAGTIKVSPALQNTTHNAGSTIKPPATTVINPAPASPNELYVADITNLAAGMSVDLGGASPETVVVQSVAPDPNPANAPKGTLSFSLINNTHVAGSTVTPVGTAVANPAPKAGTSMLVTDVSGLAVGMKVVVNGGAPESVTIQSVSESPTAAPSGIVTFTPALANAHAAGATITTSGTASSADAASGSTLIALNSRLGLSVNDVIQIGAVPDEEYVTVAAIPLSVGPPPDAGSVILAEPLALPHKAGTPVRRQAAPTPSATVAAATLALPAGAGETVLLVTGSGFVPNNLVQLTTPTGELFYHRLSGVGAAAGLGQINTLTPLERAHGAGSVVVPLNPLLTVQALDAGAWGNRLLVSVRDESPGLVAHTVLKLVINPTHVKLASAAGVEAGTMLELLDPLKAYSVVEPPVKVRSVDRNSLTVVLDTPLTGPQLNAQLLAAASATEKGVVLQSREFSITVLLLRQPDPAIPSRNSTILDREVFHNLSLDHRHSRYVQAVIGDIDGLPLRLEDKRPEGQSWYIRVHDAAQDLLEPARTAALESVRLGPEILIDILPDGGDQPARRALEGGDDSIATIQDDTYIGADAPDPVDRTGLFSLMNVDEISIIACPGRTRLAVLSAMVTQCETMRYRFSVFDGPLPPDDSINDVLAQRQQFDTKYAAIYYPWLMINDPFPQNLDNVAQFAIPPAGHVAGIYARTDEERGVHKAPANEVVNGILGLRRTLYKPQQDILNPYPVNINVIRDFRKYDRGIVVYGARVITSDSDWKYVNVRRLLIFIEATIDLGLQWVVFEVNSEPLWARVRRSIVNFLTTVWRNGALEGTTADQAFFVKCDRTTMTQTDIDNGRLIVLVGVAPVKPAEFVIVRIGLFTAQSET